MTTRSVEEQVEERAREISVLLPSRDFTQPGSPPASLDEVMDKIAEEYGDALELLGKL